MNKLNPIYILVFIITLFIVSTSMLSTQKKEYVELSKDFINISIKSKNYKEYKDTWFNTKRVLKSLDVILRTSSFKKEKILKTQNSNIIKVKIESSNPRTLDKFLKRVLNEKFRIRKLSIKKQSISIEIGLK